MIADLEEARGMAVALAPDALREAEERKNIAAGLEVVWQGRMRDAETAHQAELAATRKQLAEAQAALQTRHEQLLTARDQISWAQSLITDLVDGDRHGHAAGATPGFTRVSSKFLSVTDTKHRSKIDTSALDAAIAEAIEPYRKDAERWREYIKTLKSSVDIEGINVRV